MSSRIQIVRPVGTGLRAPPGETPPIGDNEPQFGDDPGDTLRIDDDFSSYTTYENVGSESGGFWNNGGPVWTRLAEGRNGTQSIEQQRGQDQGDDLVFSTNNIGGDHFFFTYWMKTTPGWDPSSHRTDGMKALMLNHDGNANRHQWPYTRWQWQNSTVGVTTFSHGIGREELTTGGVGNFYCWSGRVRDVQPPNFGPASDDADWSGSPWQGGMNDGNWHRVTGEIRAVDPDQYVRAWLDGVLFWDDSGQGHQYPAVEEWRWGGNYASVTGAENGSLFLDHVTIWVRE